MFTVSDEHWPFTRPPVYASYIVYTFTRNIQTILETHTQQTIFAPLRSTYVTYEYIILWDLNKLRGKGLIAKVLLINIPKITHVFIRLRYEDMCFNKTILFFSWANNLFQVVTSDNCIKFALSIVIAHIYHTLNT